MIEAVVLDIEGTTSPTSSVREDMYGYTRQHLARWLADNRSGAAQSVLAGARELAERPDADTAEIAEIMCGWLDSDVKAEPLKTAQGLICAEGFRSGDLHGEFFDDVRRHCSPGTPTAFRYRSFRRVRFVINKTGSLTPATGRWLH